MLIEKVINHALDLDPNTKHYRQKLQKKSLGITVLTLKKTFFIFFTASGIKITLKPADIIDVTISGPLQAFINLVITKNTHQSAQMGLSFEGDLKTVETVQELFLSLDIDWEEALSPWTGNIIAHQLGKISKQLKNSSAKGLSNTLESLSDYLKEESLILPTPLEVDAFMNHVDHLRADVDRLEARLLRLSETSV